MDTRDPNRHLTGRLPALVWALLGACTDQACFAQAAPSADSATGSAARLPIEAAPQAATQPDAPGQAGVSSQAELRRLLDAKQYEQAVTEARQQVATAEQQPGPGGEYLQVALMNLGLAQYLAQDYVGAEAAFLRVIELIGKSGSAMPPRLARAHAGLATTYYAGKRYDLAVTHYEQAIALLRREQGLFTEKQFPYLLKYADALTELARAEDAQRVYRYMLRATERKYGADSVRYAQELESIGRWYTRVRAYEPARASLRQSIRIIEAARGENAPELIGPLTALAECARRQLLDPETARAESADQQRQTMFRDPMLPVAPVVSSNSLAIEGENALERAVAIASRQVPQSRTQIADVRTQLGDWYQSRQKTDLALASYQGAWQAGEGATADGGKPVNELLFGRPVLLAYVPPNGWDRYAGRPAGEATLKVTQVRLTVTARGKVADPKVVDDAGDPKRGAQAQRAAQSAIYRPRFEKGAAVDTPGVALDQPFYVLVGKDEEPAAPPAPAGDSATPSSTSPAPAEPKDGKPAAESPAG